MARSVFEGVTINRILKFLVTEQCLRRMSGPFPQNETERPGTPVTTPSAADSGWFSAERRRLLTTSVVSLLLHALVLLLLGLWLRPLELKQELISLLLAPSSTDQELIQTDVDVVVQPDTLVDGDVDDSTSAVEVMQLNPLPGPVALEIDDQDIAAAIDLADADAVLGSLRGDFGGRSEKGRMALVRKFGGTADSERAVASGLKWLASIQKKNGCWDFADVGEADGAGRLVNGQMGATAMSLLCFLGAGHTHGSDTEYSDNAVRGIRYLIKNKKVIARAVDLRGNELGNGGMYIQGLATIALCEAHALTRGGKREDKLLRDTAQGALRFIENAQDSKAGGWRYKPRDPGDTSVVGWQIMALKSGKAGRLKVQTTKVFPAARRFLKSVQVDGGSQYGYTQPQRNLSLIHI